MYGMTGIFYLHLRPVCTNASFNPSLPGTHTYVESNNTIIQTPSDLSHTEKNDTPMMSMAFAAK